jgi:transcriptional regulator with XRE-family HTH domain
MKKETIIQDLLDFLGLSQNQLAEFFNISRTLFTRSALGSRKFPFRLNQRRLDMLNLMARMKAETAGQPAENPTGFSPSFVESRREKVENRIRILKEQLEKSDKMDRTRRNALAFYDRMKTEFTDLTPLDLAWIQKETDKITPHLSEDSTKEQKQWELKMLQMELKELNG